MLKHPTLDLLGHLGLTVMAKAFAEMEGNDNAASLSHAEWLALLLDYVATYRNDRRLALRLRHAKLRHPAVPADINYRTSRSLERRLFETLLAGEWISRHENLAMIGPTGIGKSWLACAIGHKACRDNRSVLYTRLPRLTDELTLAKGDGRIAARMKSLARVDLLILVGVDGPRTASKCARVSRCELKRRDRPWIRLSALASTRQRMSSSCMA